VFGGKLQFLSQINFLYSLSGLVVGILVGITGVGGGSLMTPLLVLLFGIHPATAVGTDLLYAAITKSAGTVVHGFNKTIQWRIVACLAAGSVPAALMALYGLSMVDRRSYTVAATISYSLGWALLVTAVVLIFRGPLIDLVGRWRQDRATSPALVASGTVAFGALLGLLVTITSVGAGALGVTVLILLYPRLATTRIVGSDIVHAVPLTLVAGMGYWLIGEVDWPLLVSLLIGSIPGIIIGSLVGPKLPDFPLRILLSIVLFLVGIKLITD
jgi:uncharacterized protein